jgi:hypothetical protein
VIQAQEKEEEVQAAVAITRGKRAAAVWFALLLRRDFVLTRQINYAGGGVARARERKDIFTS